LGFTVGREVGVDGGELAGEVVSGVSERFGPVGERLAGGHAGDGDVGPVDIEPVQGTAHGVTSPLFRVFEPVMRCLFALEASHAKLGAGEHAGGVNYGLLVGDQSFFESVALGAPGAAQGPEGSEVTD
jgi:hypothetical protein